MGRTGVHNVKSPKNSREEKKCNKRHGVPKARSHSAKPPNFEKELKKNSEPGMVVHFFNPNSPEAEADKSLSFRLTWATEQDPEKPSLHREGNH